MERERQVADGLDLSDSQILDRRFGENAGTVTDRWQIAQELLADGCFGVVGGCWRGVKCC